MNNTKIKNNKGTLNFQRPFRHDFIPEINQKSYQSQDFCVGKIVKITKESIYFDAGFKSLIKTKKKTFVKTFFEIEKILQQRYNNKPCTLNSFFENVKLGRQHKFIIYQIKKIDDSIFIHFDKTLEYVKQNLCFYELATLQRQNLPLQGFVLNNVNGGFSVGINGLVAFIPNNQLFPKKVQKNASRRNFILKDASLKFKILNINFDRKNVVLKKV